MAKTEGKDSQRIAKLLARAGVASRREIERMIAEGRVALGGKVLDTPATLLSSLHGVTVDGEPVQAAAPARLFLFHKPVGVLTAASDPQGRATIYDRLPSDLPRVIPVGRLDLNTEGLLLLTTDGELKRQLELPATGVERSYRARAYGQVSQQQLEDLIEGIEIEGVRYGSIDANLERRTGANVWIEMTLKEGKNREVRRVLEHLGLRVSRLIRTRYGPFVLGDMPVGTVGEVRQHDLIVFRNTLKGPGRAPQAPVAVDTAPKPVVARAAAQAAVRTARARPDRKVAVAEELETQRPRFKSAPRDRAKPGDSPRAAPTDRPARGPDRGRPDRAAPAAREDNRRARPSAPTRDKHWGDSSRAVRAAAPARSDRARPDRVRPDRAAPARDDRSAPTPSHVSPWGDPRKDDPRAAPTDRAAPSRDDTRRPRPQTSRPQTSQRDKPRTDSPKDSASDRPARPQRKSGWARAKPKPGPKPRGSRR